MSDRASDQMEDWVAVLRDFALTDPLVDGRHVTLTDLVEGAIDLPVGDAPDGVTLVIPIADDRVNLSLISENQPPAVIELITGSLAELWLIGLWGNCELSIRLDDQPHDGRLRLRGGDDTQLRELRVSSGFLIHDMPSPMRLRLEECAFQAAQWPQPYPELFLNGDITIKSRLYGSSTVATDLRIAFDGGEVYLGEISFDGEAGLALVSGATHVSSLPDGTRIALEAGAQLNANLTRDGARNLTVEGRGVFQLTGGSVIGLKLIPDDNRQIELVVASAGRVLEASGSARLNLAAGSVCTGSSTPQLSAKGIETVANAQLEEVDVYGLGIPDLDNSQRLSDLHLGCLLGSGRVPENGNVECSLAPRMIRQLRTCVPISGPGSAPSSKTNHAPGVKQANVRYAAALHSWKAAPTPSLDKFLYLFYWLVGFGERVVRPLIVFGLFSLLVSFMADVPYADVIFSPLVRLGVTEPSASEIQRGWLAATNLVGATCIIFTILASRRRIKIS